MCRRILSSLTVSVCLLTCALAGDDADSYLLKDVWKLNFEGNESFDDTDIRNALALDGPVQLMVFDHFDATMFRAAVMVRLRDGYRSKGFADVVATRKPGPDDQPLTIIVNEGPRYICGEIRIAGDSAVERQLLITGLRIKASDEDEKSRDEKEEQWVAGDITDFSERNRKRISNRVARLLLLLQGFHFPEFDVAIVADADSKTAALNVDVKSSGGRQRIDKVEITGLDRNTEAEVLKVLALPEPLFATSDLEASVTEKIEATGRFVFAHARTDTPFGPDDALTLHINVLEYEKIAPLAEEPDPIHAAMIGLAKWLRELPQSDEELKVSLRMVGGQELVNDAAKRLSGNLLSLPASLEPHRYQASFLLAGKGGGILRLTTFNQQEGLIADFSVLGLRQLPGFINWKTESRWISDSPPQGLTTTLKLAGHEPDEKGHRFNITVGFGASSDERPINARVLANPAALAEFIQHDENATIQTENNISRITFELGVLEIESVSGALRHATLKADGYELTIEGRSGLLNEAIADLKQQTESWPNLFNATQPFRSVLRFATSTVEDLVLETELNSNPAYMLAMRFLKDDAAMGQLSDRLEAWKSERNFSIPANDIRTNGSTKSEWTMAVLQGLVPTGSAAHRLMSAIGMKRDFGQPTPLATMLAEIVEDDRHGAVTCWLTGYLVPSARPMVAVAGLKRIDSDALPPEVVALLDEPCVLGQSWRSAVEIVRELSDDEVNALIPLIEQGISLLNNSKGEAVRIKLRLPIEIIRNHPSDDANELLKGLLSMAWAAELRPILRTQFEAWKHQTPSSKSIIRSVSSTKHADESDPKKKGEEKSDEKAKAFAPIELPDTSKPIFELGAKFPLE